MPGARDPLVALDVGTSTITAVVGVSGPGRSPEIVGMGVAGARGLRRGVVVHLDDAAASVREALAAAELTSGRAIDRVSLSLAGAHISSLNSRGVVAATGRTREITETDVQRAIDAAATISVPPGYEILHLIPQEFVVDDQDGVISPVGMIGSRLEVNLQVVTGRSSSILNLTECVRRAGATVDRTVLGHLAAACAIVTEDEKQLGVAVVDVGGGTINIGIFHRGVLCHTGVLAVGGDRLTDDLAVALRMPLLEAEKIKRRHGRARSALIDPGEQIRITTVGGRASRLIPRRLVSEILEPRVEEILHRLWDEIRDAGFSESLAAGAVLTGGGAMLQELPEMAAEIFDLPVRRGAPVVGGALADLVGAPAFATAVGLLMQVGAADPLAGRTGPPRPGDVPARGGLGRVVGRLRELLRPVR